MHNYIVHSLEAGLSVTDIEHGSEPETNLGVSSVSIGKKNIYVFFVVIVIRNM